MRILPQGEEFSMLQPCLHCCIEELPRVVEFEKDGQNPRGGGRWKAARSTELENLKRISGNLHRNLFNSVVITSHIQATPTGSQPSGVCEGTEPYEFLRVETRSGATQTDHYAACAQSNPPPSRQSEFRSSIRSTIEPGEVVITEKKKPQPWLTSNTYVHPPPIHHFRVHRCHSCPRRTPNLETARDLRPR